MNTRHTGPLGPPSTEPKVRGSNPLGRVSGSPLWRVVATATTTKTLRALLGLATR